MPGGDNIELLEPLVHTETNYPRPHDQSNAESHLIVNEITQQTFPLKPEIDEIDPTWYGWEELHRAASSADPQWLKTTCQQLGRERINTLTMLSENALHVLLTGDTAETFYTSLQNGCQLIESRFVNKERDNVYKCAEILIEAGININHTNFWNETPILIAIKRKNYEIVKLLLKYDVDLESSRDPVTGKTALEFLKGKEEVFGVLPCKVGGGRTEDNLFYLLKTRNEEEFLKYAGGKLQKCDVDALDSDNAANSSCTMLQYCFRRGLIALNQQKLDWEVEMCQDITASHQVQVFCDSGMAKAIQHLLENGADVDRRLRKFEGHATVLEAAIRKGYFPFVTLILGQKTCTLDQEKVFNALETLVETKSDTDLNNTLSVVLNRLLEEKIDVEKLIKVLRKGLRSISKENLLFILKFRGSLATKPTISEKTCLGYFTCKTYEKNFLEEIDPEVIRTHLDECVEQKDGKVKINYNSFISDENDTQKSIRQVLETFVSCTSLNSFLDHPVFKILVLRKWNQLYFNVSRFRLKYFYLNLWFYVLFYLLLNCYVVLRFNEISDGYVAALKIVGILFLVIFILKEVSQMMANFWRYLCEFNNYSEIFFAAVTTAVYLSYHDVAAVLAVLGSNLVLLLLLEQVPNFAKYIIILRTIFFYLKYILFYFIQFLAFAICFYILFANSDQVVYRDLPNKIFETIILFTGNLDYMETPWKNDNSGNGTNTKPFHDFQYKEAFSKIIMILFVLFMAVILNNLLLGLLVTDMNDINKNVKLIQQLKRAGFIVRLEKFFESRYLKCIGFLKNGKNCVNEVTVEDSDRKILDEDEKQHLDFMLTKKVKRENTLKKLYSYIKTKINEPHFEGLQHELNKELLEKLERIERRIRNLADTTRNK